MPKPSRSGRPATLDYDPADIARIRDELLADEIERLQAERRRVRALIPSWRTYALRAVSDDQRDTWILAAEQLDLATSHITELKIRTVCAVVPTVSYHRDLP